MTESDRFAATSIERQFWLLERLAGGTTAYHVPNLFEIQGAIDRDALKRSFEALTRRHSALRSTFEQVDGQLQRIVHETAQLDFRVVPGEAERDLPVVRELLERPFDLEHGPLQRVALFEGSAKSLLVWCLHHIVVDLRSKEILSQELARLYRAFHLGQDPDLPAVTFDPKTHTEVAQARATNADAASYFRRSIPSSGADLDLFVDFPRPKTPSSRGSVLQLPPTDRKAMIGLAARLTSQPFLVLLAASAILLLKRSRGTQLVLGVPLSNRRDAATKDAVGCFVNTLPISVVLDHDSTFGDVLRQVRLGMLGAHRHQETPLQEILQAVAPQRDLRRPPLYQAGFTFEPPMELELAGADVLSIKTHAGGSQLELFFTFWESATTIEGRLEYCTDLFSEAHAKRLVDGLGGLTNALLASESPGPILVTQLPVVGLDERRIVTETFQAARVTVGPPGTLHERFLEQASRTPHRTAVRFGNDCLSYVELADRAGRLAARLTTQGIGPGDFVALYTRRSLERIVAIYAVLLAGAAYVPLDPSQPQARLLGMLEDVQPACVLIQPGLAFPSDAVPQVTIQLDALSEGPALSQIRGNASSGAYVIFTSGSTGKPKGALNLHEGIVNRIAWMQKAFPLTEQDVVLHKTPYGFDVSTWEFFWPLLYGATLEIAPPDAHRDPAALSALITKRNVTTLHFVPSMLQAFIDHPSATTCRCLKRIICSGEALPTALVRQTKQLLPAEVHNLYGPTEAAVDVTWWDCQENPSRDPVPIGRPIDNAPIAILDPVGLPVGVGTPGELHIGGIQVAAGYVNRPELTAEKFISTPPSLAAILGPRLYRTGDLARWEPDSNIAFLGRLDHQVKISGLRIELGEIESTLDNCPEVERSVVVPRGGKGGLQRLVAYVVLVQTSAAREALEQVRRRLTQTLPNYMLPAQFVVLNEFPLSPNGKLDRSQLPEPELPPASTVIEQPQAEPGSMTAWLASAWKDLLAHDQFARDSNFFQVGGTSLMCVRLVTLLKTTHDIDLPVVRLFEHPTFSSLASHLEALVRENSPGEDPPDAVASAMARAQERGARRRVRRPR